MASTSWCCPASRRIFSSRSTRLAPSCRRSRIVGSNLRLRLGVVGEHPQRGFEFLAGLLETFGLEEKVRHFLVLADVLGVLICLISTLWRMSRGIELVAIRMSHT